ncbi:hypothetical protein PRJBM_01292 [Bartonella henselae]|uniref:hypothetical protein n=1 Tax=Bartonella henselae TaxID=38323 RepID=UPI0002E35F57|nr:hypothetical protein [Bartonella henselae]ETS07480.1 hypothetical protein Q654_01306 [Bartonella henselae JK 50]MDM9984667.1 hypothetical protein [Bartonella henselae]CDO40646.1 hypothetical protein PRJBM_01292 [Bartonella henselae]CUH91220.1 hypothetical protein BM1374164_01292 [Bartonella henselae]
MRITIFESKDHKKKGIPSLLLTEIGSYYLESLHRLQDSFDANIRNSIASQRQ